MDQINYTYFSRRLSFSPDGSILLVPAGIYYENPQDNNPKQCVYAFTRKNFSTPAFMLPTAG